MIVLENEEIKVVLSSKGAELVSLVDRLDQTEYIWQANPDIWGYHAPNLFPIVGGLKDDTLLVNGEAYHLKRHGFARTSVFRRIESAPQHAHFELRYSEQTLKMYPYKFEFQVVYHLTGRKLRVMYKIINMDEKKVFFSVGAHPAFNVPFRKDEKFEDYKIEFQYDDQLMAHQLSDHGLFNGKVKHIPTQNQELKLSKTLFDHDALVFKNLKSRSVTLKSNYSNKSVLLEFPHFNYLGLWSKADAPFVCIEPWLGCADSEGELKDISKKEAIQNVKHGHVYETEFCITI